MTLPERRPGSTRSRPPRAAHPPAARQLGPRRPRRRRRRGCDRPRPATAGARRRRPPRSQRRRARRASGRSGSRPPPGRRRGRAAPGRQRVEQRRPRRAARRPGGPAAGRGRDRPPRAHSGSSSWRTRLRTNAGSSLLASHTGVRPAAAHSAWVSLRRSPSSGCRGPGAMPASPSAPGAAQQVHRIVSAWSSMVCPVATSGGQHGEAGRPGPGLEVGPGCARRHGGSRSAAPNRCRRAAAPRRPRPPEPARRPWSTWIAVTSHPAAVARTSRASESAPPDTAQASGRARRAGRCTGSAGRGRAAEGRVGASLSHRPGPPRPPGRGSPRAWAATRGPPRPGPAAAGPPAASTDSTKRSPSAYWRILASRPSSFDISLASPRAWVRRSCSTWEKCAAPGTSRGARPVHGHVAVALEQAHHPRDLRQREPLLGRGQHADHAAVVGRVAPGPQLGGGPAHHLGQPGRVARERPEQLGRPGRRSGRAARARR